MRPEVGGKGEVGIQRWRPNSLLKPSQIGRLIANEGEELLSRPVTPVGELIAVFFLVSREGLALSRHIHTPTRGTKARNPSSITYND